MHFILGILNHFKPYFDKKFICYLILQKIHAINKIQKSCSGRSRQTMNKIKGNHILLWKVISSIRKNKGGREEPWGRLEGILILNRMMELSSLRRQRRGPTRGKSKCGGLGAGAC